jgi:hypothetical protein
MSLTDYEIAEKAPQGSYSGPHQNGDRDKIREVSEEQRVLCGCGHTLYLHGDRAVCLCGGYEYVRRQNNMMIPIRCNCKGFENGES